MAPSPASCGALPSPQCRQPGLHPRLQHHHQRTATACSWLPLDPARVWAADAAFLPGHRRLQPGLHLRSPANPAPTLHLPTRPPAPPPSSHEPRRGGAPSFPIPATLQVITLIYKVSVCIKFEMISPKHWCKAYTALLHLSLPPHRLLVGRRCRLFHPPTPPPSRLSVRAAASASAAAAEAYGLPFPPERASHHRELAAAAAAVERACRLCVDVKSLLLSGDKRILEKNDQSPVTIADFGVQALISLELQQLFPSIPLVAEEDSAFLRLTSTDDNSSNVLVESISSAVADKVNNNDSPLTHDDVLRAIDRGGKDAVFFDSNPATYWVLDPIDGTKGFLKGDDAMYVVGLALVVNGKVAVGVMGCPNWTDGTIASKKDKSPAACPGHGILMVSHVGCGTWSRHLSVEIGQFTTAQDVWKRCFVDPCSVVHMARFCIPDSQTWNMIPLSVLFGSTMNESDPRDENKILLLSACCGSLCKYLMVASGRASVFVQRARVKTLIKAWDHAVGVICVQEAGGQISDWSGKPLDFSADLTGRRIIYPSGGVLVTNGALHDKLVEMMSANYK